MNLTMVRGDTPTFDIAVKKPDGTPLSLAGAQMWFTAKKSTMDTDLAAVFQKTIGSGITVTDATAGLAEVTLAAADTSALPSRIILEYDVQVKDVIGGVYTIARGWLTVSGDITRSTA
jgi:hypothetical protein